jgi:selenide, water dikinase
MGPEALAHVLRPLAATFGAEAASDLLVGLGHADDAAVYRLNDDQAIVATTDFFPPVVDDPYAFGAIAAANALSDIYAMGGDPLFALNLVGFPDDLDPEILTEILRGGAEKVREAGALIAGGHSVTDHEPKYGLAAIGLVHPARIFTKGGARAGDSLVLTKAIGTGVITTAAKAEQADEADLAGAIASMMRLNGPAMRALRALGTSLHRHHRLRAARPRLGDGRAERRRLPYLRWSCSAAGWGARVCRWRFCAWGHWPQPRRHRAAYPLGRLGGRGGTHPAL